MLNEYIEYMCIELKINNVINKKLIIENYNASLFELEYLEHFGFKDVWNTYRHIFIQDEVVDAPEDLDDDNLKLFSFLKEQAH